MSSEPKIAKKPVTKPIQTQVRFSEPELIAVKEAARKQGFNVSQWIRFVIWEHLKKQGIEIEE